MIGFEHSDNVIFGDWIHIRTAYANHVKNFVGFVANLRDGNALAVFQATRDLFIVGIYTAIHCVDRFVGICFKSVYTKRHNLELWEEEANQGELLIVG